MTTTVNGYVIEPGTDLTGANLSGANLAGLDLSGCVLVRAYLGGANLSGTALAGADLTSANLRDVILTSATDFKQVVCDRAVFSPRLRWPALSMTGARFRAARLAGSRWEAISELRDIDLRGARLERAGFRGLRLVNVTLRGASLRRADFQGIVAETLLDLRRAWLVRASFRGADLRAAKLGRARVDGADFAGALMIGTDTEGVAFALEAGDGALPAGYT